MKDREDKISAGFHLLYLLLAAGFTYFYYKRAILVTDLHSPSSLSAASSFTAYKPFQFRLLVPLLFGPLKLFGYEPGRIALAFFSGVIVYLIILVQQKILCRYFKAGFSTSLLAAFVLYPMAWNYIVFNSSFMYYDFTAILLFSLGLYFILSERFVPLLFVFVVGLLNKETIIYLAFAYVLFNYKGIFNRKILLNLAIFAVVFLVFKLSLSYLFQNNPGDNIEICYMTNLWIIEDLFTNPRYTRVVFLNFGGLYLFMLLYLFSGRWKLYPDRRKVLLNFVLFIYLAAGVIIVYFTEIRVYSELIPIVTIFFVLFLSTFRFFKLQFNS